MPTHYLASRLDDLAALGDLEGLYRLTARGDAHAYACHTGPDRRYLLWAAAADAITWRRRAVEARLAGRTADALAFEDRSEYWLGKLDTY